MDKNNLKILVEKAINLLVDIYSNGDDDGERILQAIDILSDASKSLSASAWVSVEDDLPELEETVVVCNKENPADMWFCHRADPKQVITDKHGFANRFEWEKITHWQRIKELEV